MKCPKCGAEISEDAKFCSYCGYKIETNSSPIMSENASNPDDIPDEIVTSVSGRMTFKDKIKAKIGTFWNAQDLFCKFFIVSIRQYVMTSDL